MYQWVRAYGAGSAVSENIAKFFFLLLMIFGNIVLFSLFTAILLRNFEGGDEDEEEEDEEGEEEDGEEKERKPKISCSERWENFKEGFKEAFGKRTRKQPETEEDKPEPVKPDPEE